MGGKKKRREKKEDRTHTFPGKGMSSGKKNNCPHPMIVGGVCGGSGGGKCRAWELSFYVKKKGKSASLLGAN